MEIVFIGLLLCLLIVFFQDWNYRAIHVLLPVLIFLLSYIVIKQKNIFLIKNILFNVLFFFITFGILIVYMSLKSKSFTNPFQNYFGLGYLLFYISISPLFILKNYIIYFILSMLFAIVLQYILQKKMKHVTVPLAGFSSLLLFLLLIIDSLFSIQKISLI